MNIFDFYNFDYQKTLFPLESNRVILKCGFKALHEYSKGNVELWKQQPVSALKKDGSLRTTVKLDPFMDYIFYSFVLNHQKVFEYRNTYSRTVYGYYFDNGRPRSIAKSYNEFQATIRKCRRAYKYYLKLDVKAYFDSMSLSDFMKWLRKRKTDCFCTDLLESCFNKVSEAKIKSFLPQGIYPTKLLGSHYLSFLERDGCLYSDRSVRFLDDIYLFSDDPKLLARDFHTIQYELRERGLSINPSKTYLSIYHSVSSLSGESLTHSFLHKKRLQSFEVSDGETLFDGPSSRLTSIDRVYLDSRIKNMEPYEEDVDVLLTFLRDDADEYLSLIDYVIYHYPYHTKSLYYFIKYIKNHKSVVALLRSFLQSHKKISEYQLFWITKIALYLRTACGEDVSLEIFNHPNVTVLIQSKILEEPGGNNKILDIGRDFLSITSEGLLAYCAAFGQRESGGLEQNIGFRTFSERSSFSNVLAKIISNSIN